MTNIAADRLAYFVAKAISRGSIGSRSAIGDALLDYLQIGTLDGPPDVPTWISNYEKSEQNMNKVKRDTLTELLFQSNDECT